LVPQIIILFTNQQSNQKYTKSDPDVSRYPGHLCTTKIMNWSRDPVIKDNTGVADILASKLNAIGIKTEIVEDVNEPVANIIFLEGLNTLESENRRY